MNLSSVFRHRFTFAFFLLGLVILTFIIWPLVNTIFSSDPGRLWETLRDSQVIEVILRTFYASLIATVAGVVFGVPLAYLLARHDFPGKRLVEAAIDVPIVIPHTAVGIALLFSFGRMTPLGSAFHALHIDFVGSLAGIVIAMMFVSVPFLVDSAKEGFKSVDPRLENVARTLGASQRQTFFRVSLPLAWRSIFSGCVMMWARGISEFGAVIILAYHPLIAPTLLYERFESYGLDYSGPVAVLLILIAIVVFVVLRLLALRGAKS
jgi:molybdate/tungstate transport system permease protein